MEENYKWRKKMSLPYYNTENETAIQLSKSNLR